jgi:hypothetical protein
MTDNTPEAPARQDASYKTPPSHEYTFASPKLGGIIHLSFFIGGDLGPHSRLTVSFPDLDADLSTRPRKDRYNVFQQTDPAFLSAFGAIKELAATLGIPDGSNIAERKRVPFRRRLNIKPTDELPHLGEKLNFYVSAHAYNSEGFFINRLFTGGYITEAQKDEITTILGEFKNSDLYKKAAEQQPAYLERGRLEELARANDPELQAIRREAASNERRKKKPTEAEPADQQPETIVTEPQLDTRTIPLNSEDTQDRPR